MKTALLDLSVYDYSLIGKNAEQATKMGLADAAWYTSPVPKAEMRKLLQRKDGPALRDTAIWFALLIGFGFWGYSWWGSYWAIIPFMLYGVIYGSTSDSRWHESSHGTAFKTDWLNNFLYELSSFMVMRESTIWRWSHTRHHSDTIIVGRDPEIAVPRPVNMLKFFINFSGVLAAIAYFKSILFHLTGRLTEEEKTFVPESEYSKVIWKARIYIAIYITVFALAWQYQTILPLLFVGLPNFYGAWLMPIYGNTQHAGLAENVLDHRLNCRTVHMNLINRYLYWNMNYHVEHHMFPLVPYHALPKLHELVKSDMPTPYPSIWNAYCEIVPAIWRQRTDPTYHVKRKIPTPTQKNDSAILASAYTSEGRPVVDGWVEVCSASVLQPSDVIRFDHEKRTYAIYRTDDDQYYATDGICTHGNAHLADGMVLGKQIECPKHNGRFDLRDGSPQRKPVCQALKTYDLRVQEGKLFFNVKAHQKCPAGLEKSYSFKVVQNDNVATFIKELVLEPITTADSPDFQPGDYIQFEIPAYGAKSFSEIEVKPPYSKVWKEQHLFELKSKNEISLRRNYSLATRPGEGNQLRFNIRIATPPKGQECDAGAGSTYMHSLKAGDLVKAFGPFGEFHIKPTDKEMIYIGGGAGMAPLRSHLSHLFETLKTGRKVSFWYGARSLQELFYQDYFEGLAKRFPNFTLHLALSEPQPGEPWDSHIGFIHNILKENYLKNHPEPSKVEYYLCGPPLMIQATTKMLKGDFDVPSTQIAFDEF